MDGRNRKKERERETEINGEVVENRGAALFVCELIREKGFAKTKQ